MSDVAVIVKASAHDINVMARTIYGEARSETWLGKIQVGIVILNRFKSGRWLAGETIAQTCLRPYQFSCWNEDDPNLPKLRAVTLDDVDFQECMGATLNCILGFATGVALDWTGTHYKVVGTPAAWAEGRAPDFTIGRHEFYSGIT